MKSIFIVIINLSGIYIASGQDVPIRNDVSTPSGSNVVAYFYFNDMPEVERKTWDEIWQERKPNAELINTLPVDDSTYYSTTRHFNCHGYAWHMKEVSTKADTRWIGRNPGNTDEHIYWLDGSYIEIPYEEPGCVVVWDPEKGGDHSAIATETPGVYISKWNWGPLFRHRWEDYPNPSGWTYSDFKFYKLYRIIMSNKIISQDIDEALGVFTFKNVVIQNSADITIEIENEFNIIGPFEFEYGATLQVSPK